MQKFSSWYLATYVLVLGGILVFLTTYLVNTSIVLELHQIPKVRYH